MQFGSTVLVTVTALLSVISAQTYYTTNPDDIDILTKQTWCSDQIASCGLLCLDQNSGGGYTNTCSTKDLSWQCVCADGTVPNATQYTQTIPYFICTDEVQNCVNNCPQADATCSQACVNGKVCGATDPKPPTTTSKTAGSHTATGAGTGTAAPSASGTSSDSGDDAPYDAPSGVVTPGSTKTATSDNKSDNNKSNAGNKLSAVSGAAFSVMILSFLCGSFVILL